MKTTQINKLVFILLLGISPALLSASTEFSTSTVYTWIFRNMLFVVAGIVIFGALISLWKLMNAFIYDKRQDYLLEQGISIEKKVNKKSFLSVFIDRSLDIVPVSEEEEIVLDHDYDGIRELDNSLPPWWLYGFYFTILVAVGYLYVYEFSDIGVSQAQEYERAIEQGEISKAEFAARQVNTLDEKNLVALSDEKSLEVGEKIYIANCAACHGAKGEGGVGPNMTDNYWIHGGSIVSIYETIKYGVPEKGMIAWQSQLQPTTMHKVASYIKTLTGTNPPNPKDKEGTLYIEETESPDSN